MGSSRALPPQRMAPAPRTISRTWRCRTAGCPRDSGPAEIGGAPETTVLLSPRSQRVGPHYTPTLLQARIPALTCALRRWGRRLGPRCQALRLVRTGQPGFSGATAARGRQLPHQPQESGAEAAARGQPAGSEVQLHTGRRALGSPSRDRRCEARPAPGTLPRTSRRAPSAAPPEEGSERRQPGRRRRCPPRGEAARGRREGRQKDPSVHQSAVLIRKEAGR